MRRNVVVLCLDGVRADTFAARAARLGELADVTVRGCRAASGWSVPGHASMLTGRLPHDHGVHALSPRYDALDAGGTLLGDVEGRTVGVSANPYAGPEVGFDTLFDEFHEVSRDRPAQRGLHVRDAADEVDPGVRRYAHVLRRALTHDSPGRSLANVARVGLDRLVRGGRFDHEPARLDEGARTIVRLLGGLVPDAEREAPVFAFVDFAEASGPMVDRRGLTRGPVPAGWSSEVAGLTPEAVSSDPDEFVQELAFYRHLYAQNVEYLDRLCADLAEDLLRVTERETTVVVTAGHGENLLDDPTDPLFGHVGSLSEAVVHVPLVLINPPEGYPSVVEGPVSHLDFRSLVAGLAADETPALGDGPVAAELVGVTPGHEGLVAADPERWDRVRRCLYPHAGSKLVWDDRGDRVEYALDPDDPCRQERVSTGTGGVPGWAEAAFGESAAETYERTRRSANTDATAEGLHGLGPS